MASVLIAVMLLLLWIPGLCWSQIRPINRELSTNQFLLTPSSRLGDIEARVKTLREQEESLRREERVLQGDLQRIDEGVRAYLSATNLIDDPDILAFKRQLDELEAKYRAVNNAMALRLQELPRFKGHFEMKRAAYYRLQQIEKKVGELKDEQKLLQDRIDALNRGRP